MTVIHMSHWFQHLGSYTFPVSKAYKLYLLVGFVITYINITVYYLYSVCLSTNSSGLEVHKVFWIYTILKRLFRSNLSIILIDRSYDRNCNTMSFYGSELHEILFSLIMIPGTHERSSVSFCSPEK